MSEEINLKEKFKQALASTIRVISDDLGEEEEKSLVFLSSEDLLFKSISSAMTFAVEDKAILNFSFKFVSLLLI